jgi:hypothetical protein
MPLTDLTNSPHSQLTVRAGYCTSGKSSELSRAQKENNERRLVAVTNPGELWIL